MFLFYKCIRAITYQSKSIWVFFAFSDFSLLLLLFIWNIEEFFCVRAFNLYMRLAGVVRRGQARHGLVCCFLLLINPMLWGTGLCTIFIQNSSILWVDLQWSKERCLFFTLSAVRYCKVQVDTVCFYSWWGELRYGSVYCFLLGSMYCFFILCCELPDGELTFTLGGVRYVSVYCFLLRYCA